MFRGRAILPALALTLFAVVLAGGAPAAAAPPDDGKQWRSLGETTGLTASQVAQVCPRDGVTPCSGAIGPRSFDTWVWATADQVLALMSPYAPELLTAVPPFVSGEAYFWPASAFLSEVMRETGWISGYGFFTTWTAGWTSSTDEAGASARRQGRVRVAAAGRRPRRRA